MLFIIDNTEYETGYRELNKLVKIHTPSWLINSHWYLTPSYPLNSIMTGHQTSPDHRSRITRIKPQCRPFFEFVYRFVLLISAKILFNSVLLVPSLDDSFINYILTFSENHVHVRLNALVHAVYAWGMTMILLYFALITLSQFQQRLQKLFEFDATFDSRFLCTFRQFVGELTSIGISYVTTISSNITG